MSAARAATTLPLQRPRRLAPSLDQRCGQGVVEQVALRAAAADALVLVQQRLAPALADSDRSTPAA